ncbi:MAG: hypothetical protein R6U22_00370 [Desulfohalobiaceae bacterium]
MPEARQEGINRLPAMKRDKNPVNPVNPVQKTLILRLRKTAKSEEFSTGLTGLTGCYLGVPEARQEGPIAWRRWQQVFITRWA